MALFSFYERDDALGDIRHLASRAIENLLVCVHDQFVAVLDVFSNQPVDGILVAIPRQLTTATFHNDRYGRSCLRHSLGQSLNILVSRWCLGSAHPWRKPESPGLHLLVQQFSLQRLILTNLLLDLGR